MSKRAARRKQFVAPMSQEAMRRRVAKLVREGTMPSLEELCVAIVETKAKYGARIRKARREYREHISVN